MIKVSKVLVVPLTLKDIVPTGFKGRGCVFSPESSLEQEFKDIPKVVKTTSKIIFFMFNFCLNVGKHTKKINRYLQFFQMQILHTSVSISSMAKMT
jgi:hypothetical protein